MNVLLGVKGFACACLCDEYGLVHPFVTRIARLEAGAGAEVVLVPRARTLTRIRSTRGFGVLDQTGVLHVDVGAVVRVQREADVKAAVSVGPDEEPVGAAGAYGATDTVPRHLAR